MEAKALAAAASNFSPPPLGGEWMTPIFLIFIPALFALLMPLFALMKIVELRFVVALFCLLLCLMPLPFLESIQESGVIIQNINFFSFFEVTLTMGFFELMFITFFSFVSFVISLYGLSYEVLSAPSEDLRRSISFLLALAGSFGMLLSSNFGNLLFFYLFTNTSIYWLIKSNLGTEAARKIYLFSNFLSSSFLILGVFTIYQTLGSGDMYEFGANLKNMDRFSLYMAMGLFLLSFFVKAEIFPLNVWIVNLYKESEPQNVAFFSAVTTKAYFIALIQLLAIFFKLSPLLQEAMILVGGISMVFANFHALRELSIKRVLAYSSMSQIGLIIMGIGYNLHQVNEGIFFHLINHSLAISLMYLSVGYIARQYKGDDTGLLRGCSIAMPISSFFFTLGAMSLMGFPPFSGFFSKLLILKGFADYQLFTPILFIFLASLGEALLYFRIIRTFYSNRPSKLIKHTIVPNLMYASIMILGALVIYLGVFPSSLFFIVSSGVEEFMNGKILIPIGIRAFQ